MSEARLLVVDDHRDMADGIAMVLSEHVGAVEVAYSAASALKRLAAQPFDLVLSDVRMPKMDGMDLLDRLRRDYPRVKVLLITGFGTIEAAVEAMKHGASEYLTKPFDNRRLIALVTQVLDGSAKAHAAALEAPATDLIGRLTAVLSPEDLLPSLDQALEVLRQAVGADDCELFLCEPGGRHLVLTACRGPDLDALISRDRFRFGEGFPGLIASSGAAIMTDDLAQDRRYLRPAVVARGLCASVCVPVRAAGSSTGAEGILGTLHVFSRHAAFAQDRVRALLDQAARPISHAVQAGLALLRDTINTVTTPGGADVVLREIQRRIARLVGAKASTLVIFESESHPTRRVFSQGAAPVLCASMEQPDRPECAAGSLPRALTAGARRDWPEPCRSLPARVASPYCVPLFAHDRQLGQLLLDYGRRPPIFASRVLVPLATVAHQIALRLYGLSEPASLAVPADRADRRGDPQASLAAPLASGRHAIPHLTLRCFGKFEVQVGDITLGAEAFARGKARALLGVLVLREGRPITRDALMEALWPGVAPKAGQNRLHGVLHALRSCIEPWRAQREWVYVLHQGELYRFNMEAPHTVDLHEFRRALQLAEAEGANSPRRLTHLARAVEWYQGELFEHETDSDWCEQARQNARARVIEALKELAEAAVRRGEFAPAIARLQRALALDPWREDLHQALIRALLASGRRAQALERYQACLSLLYHELEVTPMPETLALGEALQSGITPSA